MSLKEKKKIYIYIYICLIFTFLIKNFSDKSFDIILYVHLVNINIRYLLFAIFILFLTFTIIYKLLCFFLS